MKVLRNIAAIGLTIMLAGGLNGCGGPFPMVNSESAPVGQIQETATTDIPSEDGNLSSASTQDVQQTVVADPSVRLSNANVKITTEAAPKPKPPVAVPAAPAAPENTPIAGNEPINTAPAPSEPVTVAAPATGGHEWIQATMAKYGIYPEPGTRFVIGPMPAGCVGADGCTEYSYYPSTGVAFDYVITIRPGQLTEYLLLHEIGHARGIRDECGADNFARSILGPVPGHYC